MLGHLDTWTLSMHTGTTLPHRLVGLSSPASLLMLAAFQIALLLKYSVKFADHCPTGFYPATDSLGYSRARELFSAAELTHIWRLFQRFWWYVLNVNYRLYIYLVKLGQMII